MGPTMPPISAKLISFTLLAAALFLASAPASVTSRPLSSSQRDLLSAGACLDVPGWYSQGGPVFNCNWYSLLNRCSRYGGGFANFGATARDACCVCGGGTEMNILRSDINATGLISNEITGDRNKGINEITGEILNTGAFKTVSDLTMNVNNIISNIIVGDGNRNILNVIKSIIGDQTSINKGEVNVEAFAINDIRGNGNGDAGMLDVDGNWVSGAIENQGFYDIIGQNGGNNVLRDIFVNVTGINYNKVGGEDEDGPGDFTSGDRNYLKNVQDIEALLDNISRGIGGNLAVNRLTLLIDAILMNEVVSGNGNYLTNLLDIAAVNGISAEDVVVDIEAIVVNQINGDSGDERWDELRKSNGNALKNIVDIGLGLCGGKDCGSLKNFDANVSAILLNDITGDNNVIKTIVDIDAASQDGWEEKCKDDDRRRALRFFRPPPRPPSPWCGLVPNGLGSYSPNALKNVFVDIEAIVVNTIGSIEDRRDGDSNDLKNEIDLDILENVKAQGVDAFISSIIANTIQEGRDNKLDNLIDLTVGDGSDTIWPKQNLFGSGPGDK